MEQRSRLSRRRLLRALAATGAAALFRPQLASSQQARVLSKPKPSTGNRGHSFTNALAVPLRQS
jgi:hypothetical protein